MNKRNNLENTQRLDWGYNLKGVGNKLIINVVIFIFILSVPNYIGRFDINANINLNYYMLYIWNFRYNTHCQYFKKYKFKNNKIYGYEFTIYNVYA